MGEPPICGAWPNVNIPFACRTAFPFELPKTISLGAALVVPKSCIDAPFPTEPPNIFNAPLFDPLVK
jgi:hypothetical protein